MFTSRKKNNRNRRVIFSIIQTVAKRTCFFFHYFFFTPASIFKFSFFHPSTSFIPFYISLYFPLVLKHFMYFLFVFLFFSFPFSEGFLRRYHFSRGWKSERKFSPSNPHHFYCLVEILYSAHVLLCFKDFFVKKKIVRGFHN